MQQSSEVDAIELKSLEQKESPVRFYVPIKNLVVPTRDHDMGLLVTKRNRIEEEKAIGISTYAIGALLTISALCLPSRFKILAMNKCFRTIINSLLSNKPKLHQKVYKNLYDSLIPLVGIALTFSYKLFEDVKNSQKIEQTTREIENLKMKLLGSNPLKGTITELKIPSIAIQSPDSKNPNLFYKVEIPSLNGEHASNSLEIFSLENPNATLRKKVEVIMTKE